MRKIIVTLLVCVMTFMASGIAMADESPAPNSATKKQNTMFRSVFDDFEWGLGTAEFINFETTPITDVAGWDEILAHSQKQGYSGGINLNREGYLGLAYFYQTRFPLEGILEKDYPEIRFIIQVDKRNNNKVVAAGICALSGIYVGEDREAWIYPANATKKEVLDQMEQYYKKNVARRNKNLPESAYFGGGKVGQIIQDDFAKYFAKNGLDNKNAHFYQINSTDPILSDKQFEDIEEILKTDKEVPNRVSKQAFLFKMSFCYSVHQYKMKSTNRSLYVYFCADRVPDASCPIASWLMVFDPKQPEREALVLPISTKISDIFNMI